MNESLHNPETHRFNISQKSLELMKNERAYFEEKKKELPELAGITFFGSRIANTEREDSDLDMVVFFDGSKGWKTENGVLQKDLDKLYAISNRVEKVFTGDSAEKLKEHDATFVLDISPGARLETIHRFGQLMKNQESGERNKFSKDFVPTEAWDLLSIFLLGVGDGLYEARSEILGILEKMPEGNERV